MSIPFEVILRDCLQDPEVAAAYLQEALEEGSGTEILPALQDIADAQVGGIDGLAKRLNMEADALRKTLAAEGSLDLNDINKIVRGLGLRLTAEPQADAVATRAEETEAAEAPAATMSVSQPPAAAAAMHAQRFDT